jgi:hypothetical protein
VNWLNDRAPIKMLEGRRKTDPPPEPEPLPADAETLLAAVADALTACEREGITVKLKHGAVITPVGYVLPLGDGEWCARTLNWSPFSAQGLAGDED